jgi:hypothetical protein
MRVLFLALLVAGCNSENGMALGDSCDPAVGCSQPLACAGDPFPGGYCTYDCTSTPCPNGETCAAIGGFNVCLKPCQAQNDCRDGYQCFHNSCQLACKVDSDCGSSGFQCTNGQCTPFSGAPVGSPCTDDTGCSSRTCAGGTCAQGCLRDAECNAGQTCFIDPTGDGAAATPTTRLRPICVARRSTGAPAASCMQDSDCDRGACQLGICVEMCQAVADCHATGQVCADMVTLLDNDTTPGWKGCLPSTGTLVFPGDTGVLPLPSNGQAFAVYSRVNPFNFSTSVGVTQVTDPTGAVIFTPAQSIAAFYMLKLRYTPTESSSTMLVPNSPMVSIKPGAWRIDVGTDQVLAVPSSTYYVKLGNQPIMSGKIDLNFYITNLSGACKVVTAANAATQLAGDISTMKTVFSQANITVENVTFHDVTASNTIKISTDPNTNLPDLDDALLAATTGQGTKAGLDVVLVRSITDQNGANVGILGVAGGIPGSPDVATPHSGAVVSIVNACMTQSLLGVVASHETAHTLGLFHSVEQDNNHDPLTDTAADGTQNLMYWSENSGTHLTLQQSQVLRNDPKVRP